MSTDYEACCENCKKYVHLGQCMGAKFSLGFGPTRGPAETEDIRRVIAKEGVIMRWIADHVDNDHRVVILMDAPDDYEYLYFDERDE